MENNDKNLENGLDQFLSNDQPTTANETKKVVKKKGDLVEKVDIERKLFVEDGRELLREITYDRY